MNISATLSPVHSGYAQHAAGRVVDDAGVYGPCGGPRGTQAPVERVVEGEVIGRRHGRQDDSAERLGNLLRMHAGADSTAAPRAVSGGRAAVALYAGVAATTERRADTATLDIYV